MVAVQTFLTQFHWFFCWLNSLFKDKLAYILTFVFFNSCIYFIVLLLLNVNLHSCMYCSIRNTKNNKKLSDWFQGLVLGPFFVLFFLQYFWKKNMPLCINFVHFPGDNKRKFPYAIKWKQRYQREAFDTHLHEEWVPNSSISSIFQSWKFAV